MNTKITSWQIKIFLLSLVVISSCIDPIDFSVPAGLSDSIVIQGRLVEGETSFVEVNISRLFDFSPESRQPVSVRKVSLFDDSNTEWVLETNVPGFYKQEIDELSPIQADIGKGYKIRVETFDNRVFESSMDVMQPVHAPSAVNIQITEVDVPDLLGKFVKQERLLLTLDTNVDEQSEGGVYWEVNVIYKITDSENFIFGIPDVPERVCYKTDVANVNEIYVLDPGQLSSNQIEGYNLLTTPIDFRAAEGLYYEVTQYSLSEGAYNYWNSINILSERQGNMFDPPVGEVPSNILNVDDEEDSVFGYFFATSSKQVRKKLDPDLIPQEVSRLCPPPRACLNPAGACICGICCNCLSDPNATTIRPTWWMD